MSNHGVPTTPMNEREPLPVQTPLSCLSVSQRHNNVILASPDAATNAKLAAYSTWYRYELRFLHGQKGC
jgi:hypothetical protein